MRAWNSLPVATIRQGRTGAPHRKEVRPSGARRRLDDRRRCRCGVHLTMDAMARKHEEFRHMEAIVRSVLDSDASDRLAAYTSMHDLIIIDLPIPEPPYGVVAVRAPSSLHTPRDGHVLIEEVSVTGLNDRIERPGC